MVEFERRVRRIGDDSVGSVVRFDEAQPIIRGPTAPIIFCRIVFVLVDAEPV
jgi:hypothetical protein